MILGAVLAGGAARRFGRDKALAQIGGVSLMDHATTSLARCCDEVVVVGRAAAPVPTLADWPRPGLGPLGGLAAALRHARNEGYSSLMTLGVDSYGLPDDLLARLGPPPAVLTSQPVIGHWPASDAAMSAISAILEGSGPRSLRAFAAALEARPVRFAAAPANINTEADLAAAEAPHAL